MPGLQKNDKLPMKKDRRRIYPKLTKEQQRLVLDNSWVAYDRAADYTEKHPYLGSLTYEDILSVCFLALCRAAIDYDPTKSTKFSTYAYPRVAGYCLTAIRDTSRMVKIPRIISSIRAQVRELQEQGLNNADIADILNVSETDVLLAEQSWRENWQTLSYSSDEEDAKELQLKSTSPFQSQFSNAANEVIANLSDKDYTMLTKYLSGKYNSQAIKQKAENLIADIKATIADNESQAD